MADDFRSLNKDTLKNVEAIKSSLSDIKDSYNATNKSLQRQQELRQNSIRQINSINNSADKFAQLQREAEKSAAGTSKALQEQQKNLNVIKQLNAQIENLYAQQARTTKKTVKDTLQRQINNLANAKDNAKELADEYGRMAEDSAKLDKSTAFFSQISEIVKDIPGLRKLSGPFEAAAEASRETVINNEKVIKRSMGFEKKFSKLTAQELKTGKGLTKERIKQLGLQKDLGKLSGGAAKK